MKAISQMNTSAPIRKDPPTEELLYETESIKQCKSNKMYVQLIKVVALNLKLVISSVDDKSNLRIHHLPSYDFLL